MVHLPSCPAWRLAAFYDANDLRGGITRWRGGRMPPGMGAWQPKRPLHGWVSGEKSTKRKKPPARCLCGEWSAPPDQEYRHFCGQIGLKFHFAMARQEVAPLHHERFQRGQRFEIAHGQNVNICLLYTSDAAD